MPRFGPELYVKSLASIYGPEQYYNIIETPVLSTTLLSYYYP